MFVGSWSPIETGRGVLVSQGVQGVGNLSKIGYEPPVIGGKPWKESEMFQVSRHGEGTDSFYLPGVSHYSMVRYHKTQIGYLLPD